MKQLKREGQYFQPVEKTGMVCVILLQMTGKYPPCHGCHCKRGKNQNGDDDSAGGRHVTVVRCMGSRVTFMLCFLRGKQDA